jgi:hypothetical protein
VINSQDPVNGFERESLGIEDRETFCIIGDSGLGGAGRPKLKVASSSSSTTGVLINVAEASSGGEGDSDRD